MQGPGIDDGYVLKVTPLMCAAMSGKRGAVKLLVENGALLDLRDKEGYTALIYAADENPPHPSVVTLLVEMGADQSIRDKTFRETALEKFEKSCFSAGESHEEVIALLGGPTVRPLSLRDQNDSFLLWQEEEPRPISDSPVPRVFLLAPSAPRLLRPTIFPSPLLCGRM